MWCGIDLLVHELSDRVLHVHGSRLSVDGREVVYDAWMPIAVDDVLSFWFGEPAQDAAALGTKHTRWFSGGPEFDREIRERFASTVERALAGDLDDWARTTRGRLALILVLDQFTRNIFRESPRAFAGDARAQKLAVEALDARLDRELGFDERIFLKIPLAHAEDLALQERSVVETDKLTGEVADWQRPIFARGTEQARKYREIIARFGRFPHRNSALGRKSTPEEEAFLVDWKEHRAPSAAKDLVK
jgi:uncharacterized protein (DUF924 family)